MVTCLACGGGPVVTSATVSCDSKCAVVDPGPSPTCVGRVTGFTRCGSGYVTGALACGNRAVVAVRAPSSDRRHINVEAGWQPGRVATLVAGCAVSRRTDVCCCFPGCRRTVMTRRTIGCCRKRGVINFRRSP